MAYTIGSDRGKKKAEDMKVGEKWTNDVDGSVWEKKPDGSISVTTDKGEKFDNAYKPNTTTANTGTYSSGNSPYAENSYTPANSQYVGKGTYNDADLPDFAKSQINAYKIAYANAIAAGDIKAADAAHTEAERIRKQYGYSGGEDGSEYIALGGKTGTTPILGTTVQDILSWGNIYNQNNAQPAYQSKYDPEIDALLDDILNRDDFSYDAQSDPLYQQYSQMYQREGDRAMKETLAEAAAGAGGMNTYAVTAAQQAANQYASQLNDKIPQLYQLAYDMYLADKESKMQDLGILQSMDATQYNRYRDTMSDWRNDKNFAYGLYQDAVAQGNWQDTFNRSNYESDRAFNFEDYWANTKWNASQESNNLANERYDRESADEQLRYIIENGGTPSPELIQRAGWTSDMVSSAMSSIKNKTNKENALMDAEIEKLKKDLNDGEDEMTFADYQEYFGYLSDLGLPSNLSNGLNILERLAGEGAISIDESGKMTWNKGWNANNYLSMLSGLVIPFR